MKIDWEHLSREFAHQIVDANLVGEWNWADSLVEIVRNNPQLRTIIQESEDLDRTFQTRFKDLRRDAQAFNWIDAHQSETADAITAHPDWAMIGLREWVEEQVKKEEAE